MTVGGLGVDLGHSGTEATLHHHPNTGCARTISLTGLAATPNETLRYSGFGLLSRPLDWKEKSNLPTSAARRIIISSRANPSAIQQRGPRLKGMNEHCILAPPFLSDSQRVMSQVDGSGEVL
jgi:hypothetical protein